MDKTLSIERSLITEYKYKIYHPFLSAIAEYSLIDKDDKIAVCISGGKDSFLMAKCFQELQKYSEVPFDCLFLLMNPGYDEDCLKSILSNAKLLNIPLNVFDTKIFKIIDVQENNKCYLCAKMRRGALYAKAQELGCNKIALGHHYNDVIETTLLSIFYSGTFETMLPKVESTNYQGLELIRPLFNVKEKDIIDFEKTNDLHFLKSGCFIAKDQSLCQSSKRQKMKKLIEELKKDNSNVDANIFRSAFNINLDKILGYRKGNKDKK